MRAMRAMRAMRRTLLQTLQTSVVQKSESLSPPTNYPTHIPTHAPTTDASSRGRQNSNDTTIPSIWEVTYIWNIILMSVIALVILLVFVSCCVCCWRSRRQRKKAKAKALLPSTPYALMMDDIQQWNLVTDGDMPDDVSTRTAIKMKQFFKDEEQNKHSLDVWVNPIHDDAMSALSENTMNMNMNVMNVSLSTLDPTRTEAEADGNHVNIHGRVNTNARAHAHAHTHTHAHANMTRTATNNNNGHGHYDYKNSGGGGERPVVQHFLPMPANAVTDATTAAAASYHVFDQWNANDSMAASAPKSRTPSFGGSNPLYNELTASLNVESRRTSSVNPPSVSTHAQQNHW